jgi:hypothetical protein
MLAGPPLTDEVCAAHACLDGVMARMPLHWSPSEKRIARRAFDRAASALLAGVLTEFKAKAAAVVEPSDMWAMEDYLRGRRREIESLLDYRYSQLPLVFACLIAKGHMSEAALERLGEDKLRVIRGIVSRSADAA